MADSDRVAPADVQDLSQPENPEKMGGWGEDFNNDRSPFFNLIKQVREEFETAYKAQKGRIDILQKRLKLYNNQRRDPEAVGDNTLFEVFQAVFAALYTDQMQVEFVGRNAGSQDKAEAINNVAKFDYDEMDKAIIDFESDWDALFFGYSLTGMNEFDRERMVSTPEVWDPTVTLRDPDGISVNGFKGKGSARYFGREIMVRGVDMEGLSSVFSINQLKLTRPTRSLYELARQSREDAQGLNNQIRYDEKVLGVNARYPLIEWYTWWKHPKLTDNKPARVMLWLGNDMRKICRFKVLKNQKYWPVNHKKLFATSHQWDSVSIPDLIEDKQRLKAVLLNLGVKMVKSDLFGMYIYDKNKIKSKGDLNWDLDKMVGVDLKPNENLNNAVIPMPKASANLAMYNWIMGALTGYAEMATGTPEAQAGVSSGKSKKETATKSNQVQAGTAARYSLASKIWGWAEKEFWRMWYDNYKEHFKPRIDEKLVRINTVFGYQYKFYQRDDLVISDIDPDIFITSKLETDQKQAFDRAATMQFGQILSSTPGSNIRYFVKKMGRLSNISSDEMNRLLPPTPDELKATNENIDLSRDLFVSISPDDNDEQHLEVHAKAKQTPATIAHQAMHIHAMELKKSNPELFPNLQQAQQQVGALPGQNPVSVQGQQMVGKAFGQINKKNNPKRPAFSPGGLTQGQQ